MPGVDTIPKEDERADGGEPAHSLHPHMIPTETFVCPTVEIDDQPADLLLSPSGCGCVDIFKTVGRRAGARVDLGGTSSSGIPRVLAPSPASPSLFGLFFSFRVRVTNSVRIQLCRVRARAIPRTKPAQIPSHPLFPAPAQIHLARTRSIVAVWLVHLRRPLPSVTNWNSISISGSNAVIHSVHLIIIYIGVEIGSRVVGIFHPGRELWGGQHLESGHSLIDELSCFTQIPQVVTTRWTTGSWQMRICFGP